MRDVLVVGGGPAGAATAIHLARAGRSVALFDRAHFPRPKACGEGLLPAGVEALGRLGVLDEVRDAAATIREVRFTAGHASVSGDLGDRIALGVQRTLLDNVLLQRAVEEGVEVRQVTARSLVRDSRGRPDGIETDAGVERARVIVAADGLGSRLRRQAGLSHSSGRRHALTAHLALPWLPDDRIDVRFRDGYELYITPVGGGVSNVALLSDRRRIRGLARERMARLRALLDAELEGRSAGLGTMDVMSAGPFPVRVRQAYRGRLVLAGDAAGFFDGITGEGISLSLLGAERCAEAIDVALATNRTASFAAYDRQIREAARNSTCLGRLSLCFARHQSLAEVAIASLANRPGTFEKLLAINQGAAGFRTLRPADTIGLFDPRLLFRTRRG